MARTVISSADGGGGTASTPSTGNWVSGTFGTGLIQMFAEAGTYTFTTTTTSIRVRVFGAGGGGSTSNSSSGGSGGGFAINTFTVISGTNYTVTVGQGGASNTAGGTSSFGNLISATGGAAGANNTQVKLGGLGAGGVINYYGGEAQGNYSGGGGVGSLFGKGSGGCYNNNSSAISNSPTFRSGGAGGGGSKSTTTQAQNRNSNSDGTFGMVATGGYGNNSTLYTMNLFYSPAAIPTCIDMLGTGPGGIASDYQGDGMNGGGGFGGVSSSSGRGGWPGGGGGAGASGSQGVGANGCVIVEF